MFHNNNNRSNLLSDMDDEWRLTKIEGAQDGQQASQNYDSGFGRVSS